MASTTYVQTYYPALLTTGAWTFQEALREHQARNWDPDRSPRGWTSIDTIRRADKAGLPPAFVEFIRQCEVPEETKHNNVRRVVKDIWTWPMVGYLPWTPIEADTVLATVQKILWLNRPKLQLVEGKVYLMLSRFTELLWHYFPELGSAIPGLARPLVKNTETEHVTIVNSEHVPDQVAVREWVSTFGTMEVSASNLKHTVSLDWARFSVCLVVGLEIAKLADFIDAYNKEFGMKARVPSAHITVAIDPRTDAQ